MTTEQPPYRVLIGKPGLDGHDRGAKFIARALRDEGFEVIYTGIRRTAAEIAATAIQEDVDVVGLSSLSGAHLRLFPEVVKELETRGGGDIPVLGLPACGMFHNITVFDLILPRVLTGETIGREEFAKMGHGGLCRNCKRCQYPVCNFGK